MKASLIALLAAMQAMAASLPIEASDDFNKAVADVQAKIDSLPDDNAPATPVANQAAADPAPVAAAAAPNTDTAAPASAPAEAKPDLVKQVHDAFHANSNQLVEQAIADIASRVQALEQAGA